MSHDPAITHTSAVAICNSAILAALVASLVRKGALTRAEEREMYEEALMLLELQGDDDFGVNRMARELIEQHLRG